MGTTLSIAWSMTWFKLTVTMVGSAAVVLVVVCVFGVFVVVCVFVVVVV